MQALFDLFFDAANVDEILTELTVIWQSDRRSTYAAWGETAELLRRTMDRDGLTLVENFRFDASGTEPYGDWPPLRAWDITESGLWLLDKAGQPVEKLTGYPDNVCATMMYSDSTPEEGAVVELVAFDADDPASMARRAVLIGERVSQPEMAHKAGAVGLVSDFNHELQCNPGLYEQAKDLTRWENAALLYMPFSGLWGFNITPATGRRVREMLETRPVRIRAQARTTFGESKLHHVRGVLAGEDLDDRVLLIAHAFEVGANDNAMGVATVLHALRLIRNVVERGRLPAPRRSIEVQFSYEVLSTLAAFRAATRGRIGGWPERYACGLNVDSAGLAAGPESPVFFSRPPAGLRGYAGELMGRLLECVPARAEGFIWRERLMTNDNMMLSDPMLGCPAALLGHQHTPAYHTDGDTPEILDAGTVRVAAALIAAFAYEAASASEEDVRRAPPAGEPGQFGPGGDLKLVPRRRVWGPLFLSAKKLPSPYDSWFGWNPRGLVVLYQMDGRRTLAEVFARAGVAPGDADEYVHLARALEEAGVIGFV